MKVYDIANKKEVEVPESELPSALKSGNFALPKGARIDVLSPDGKRGSIDSAEAMDAFNKGFQPVTLEQIEDERLQKEYGEGLGNEAKALGLATARGLTFGLSDQVLEKTGAVSEEALRELKDRNPTASITGEIAGTVAPVLLSGGSSLIAKGASKTLPSLVTNLGEKAGEAAVKSLAKSSTSKIVQNAVKLGVGSAVEGSLYGAGQLVSEEALGNADFNAESVIANVGLGAVLGGGIGGTLGGISGVGAKYLSKIKDDIKKGALSKYGLGKKQSDDLIDNINLSRARSDLPGIAENIEPSALAKEAKDVDGILEASEMLGITPTRGMLSENKTIQNIESTLSKSDMLAGQDVKQATINVFKGLEDATEDILSPGIGVKSKDEGEAIKAAIFEHYNSRLTTYKAFQDDFEEQFGQVAVNDRMRKLAKTRFLKAADSAFDDTNIQKAVAAIDKIDSISKAKQAKKYFYNEAQKARRAGDDLANSVFMDAYDTSQRMIENAAVSSIRGVRQKKLLVDNIRTANKVYSGLSNDMKEVAKFLGKNIRRPSDVAEFVENGMDSKAIVEKLSKLKNNDFLDTLQTKLPDVYEASMRYKASKIVEASKDEFGNIVPKKFLAQVKKMDQDEIERLFGPKVKKIDAIKKVMDSMPLDQNPSGTANAQETLGLFSFTNQGKALALRSLYSDGGENLANYYGKILSTLRGVEDSSNTIKTGISDSVEAFLSKSTRTASKVIAPSLSSGDMTKSFAEAKKQVEDTEGTPDATVEMFAKANKDLFDSAPGTAAMISGKLSNAVKFLSEKMPRRPVTSPYVTMEPTTREKERFLRYYNAVQKPMSVFEDLKKGYANPEGVEAIKRVYPEIYKTLSEEIMNRLEGNEITYQDRINLQKLLGVQANYKRPGPLNRQPSQAQPTSSQRSGRLGGIKMIGRDSRNQTQLERVMNR